MSVLHSITRRYEADIGHRLVGHESKCARMHGHRYVFLLTLESTQLDDVGRVVDFSKMKQLLERIVEPWDHRMLLNADDPLCNPDLGAWIQTNLGISPNEIVAVPFNPTAENMAEHVAARLSKFVSQGCRCRVQVYETPNCSAMSGWVQGVCP